MAATKAKKAGKHGTTPVGVRGEREAVRGLLKELGANTEARERVKRASSGKNANPEQDVRIKLGVAQVREQAFFFASGQPLWLSHADDPESSSDRKAHPVYWPASRFALLDGVLQSGHRVYVPVETAADAVNYAAWIANRVSAAPLANYYAQHGLLELWDNRAAEAMEDQDVRFAVTPPVLKCRAGGGEDYENAESMDY